MPNHYPPDSWTCHFQAVSYKPLCRRAVWPTTSPAVSLYRFHPFDRPCQSPWACPPQEGLWLKSVFRQSLQRIHPIQPPHRLRLLVLFRLKQMLEPLVIIVNELPWTYNPGIRKIPGPIQKPIRPADFEGFLPLFGDYLFLNAFSILSIRRLNRSGLVNIFPVYPDPLFFAFDVKFL